MGQDSATQSNDVPLRAGTQGNLETVMLSEAAGHNHIIHDSISATCPEEVNKKRQKVDWWLPRAGGEGRSKQSQAGRVSIRGDENVRKLTVMTAANILKHILKSY